MYGLDDCHIKYIRECLSNNTEVEKACLFGSRALGNYKKGSDIDLALFGEKINRKVILRILHELNEEYPIPYYFDIVDYNKIKNKELKEHIDNCSVLLYEKNEDN